MLKKPRRGRPRKYRPQAAKQRAYRQRQKRAAHLAAVREQRAARLSRLPVIPPDLPDDVTVLEGDFAVVGQEVADASVDLILTDPPYGREFLPALEALGALAARVLTPGSSLVVMSGQSCLPEVLQTLQRHLRYH
jgi:16S rRNA G966 N2-methylase RsmD